MIDTPHPTPRLAYRPEQAARMLGISRTGLYRLIRAGHLPTTKIVGATLIRHEALIALLDAADGQKPSSSSPIALSM